MIKRAFDIALSTLGLLATAPLLALIAGVIKLDSPGPVLYRQWRVGRGGELFLMYKFRTMVDGADQRGVPITVDRDPRITGTGRLLRRFHLDELPNLLNILRGNMSIVGPRPELPRYLPYYGDRRGQILSTRPGLTDPATLKFRDEGVLLGTVANPELTYIEEILPAKLRLSAEYVEQQSFWSDIRLIARTIRVILRGEGTS